MTGYDIFSVEYDRQEDLPEMSPLDFDLIFEKSEIIDGVRKFPFIKMYDNETGTFKKIYLSV